MVHRDPETGQFVSDDGTVADLAYTDFEIQPFNLEVENVGASNSAEAIDFSMDPFGRGLENSELAQMAFLDVHLSVRNDPDAGTSNTSPGTLHGNAELGINMDESDMTMRTGEDGLVETEDASGNGVVNTIAARTGDEAGSLALLTASAEAGFQDGTNTAGAGGMSGDRVQKDYQAAFGEGPWVDATDDVSGRLQVIKNTTDSDGRATLRGHLGWLVVEDESARPRFGL